METTFYSHSPICSYLKKKTCKETKQCPVWNHIGMMFITFSFYKHVHQVNILGIFSLLCLYSQWRISY
jgi:hypothetical protein